MSVDLEWWKAWFDARFGHADYLQLNRKWKLVRFEDCAKEVMLALAIEQEGGQQRIARLTSERDQLREALNKTVSLLLNLDQGHTSVVKEARAALDEPGA